MDLAQKLKGVVGRGRKIDIFVSRWTGRPYTTEGRLGTGQNVGAHTSTRGEYTDAIEAGVGADELAQPISHTLICFALLYLVVQI